MKREAGFWIRLGAIILDGIIIGLPLSIIANIITGGGDGGKLLNDILTGLYGLIVPIIWNGYTVGKRICGIRIRKVYDHQPPTFLNMLLRNIVAGIVYVLTLGIGLIVSIVMVATRDDKRALHDFIAGTEVVHD